MDKRVVAILKKIARDNGKWLYDSEYAQCLDCGLGGSYIGARHKRSCIVSRAKKLLDEQEIAY